MIGRWASTPEPVTPLALLRGGEQHDIVTVIDLAKTVDTVDIPPGSYDVLDVLVRVQGRDDCWGWHNRTIGRDDAAPEHRFVLQAGRYRALIRAQTAGRQFDYVVRIVNDVPFEDFRLEQVNPQPKVASDL